MNSSDQEVLIISHEEAGLRLDQILTQRFKGQYSRTYFQFLIQEHLVLINGAPCKKRFKVNEGDEIEIEFALIPGISLEAQNIPLEIRYEDEDLLVVNKPSGMVVHPAPGNPSGTFVNALLYHCKQFEIDQSIRPGIVHRLDKETSGLLIAAKNTLTQQKLIEQFSKREVYKEYLAICMGNPGSVTISQPIGRDPIHRQKMAVLSMGGKEAITICQTLNSSGKYSLINVILKTGRTHQIRVHLKSLGHSILGDTLYGNDALNKQTGAARQMLHASYLRFQHPHSLQTIELKEPLPTDMEFMVKKLGLSTHLNQ